MPVTKKRIAQERELRDDPKSIVRDELTHDLHGLYVMAHL